MFVTADDRLRIWFSGWLQLNLDLLAHFTMNFAQMRMIRFRGQIFNSRYQVPHSNPCFLVLNEMKNCVSVSSPIEMPNVT